MTNNVCQIAVNFTDIEAEVRSLEADYKAAKDRLDEVRDRLTSALLQAEILETIAINLDDSAVLVCDYDGENDYDYNLIRSIN